MTEILSGDGHHENLTRNHSAAAAVHGIRVWQRLRKHVQISKLELDLTL